MRDQEILEIRGAPQKLLPVISIFSVFIAGGAWLVLGRDMVLYQKIVGYLSLVVFGLPSLIFFWRFFTAYRVVVTLSPEGIKDIRLSREVLPWDAVRGCSVYHAGRNSSVALTIDPSMTGTWSPSGLTKWLDRIGLAGESDTVAISGLGLDIDVEILHKAISPHVRYVEDNREMATEVVRFYQQIGFFPERDPADVVRQYMDDWGRAPQTDSPWDDAFLLAFDKEQVWADDPEADVARGSLVYVEVLKEWARISKGTFAPSGITEYWKGESGPITLNFQLNGQSVTLSPIYLDDWIDLSISEQINPFIASSGRQFEFVLDGNFALVLCLTKAQKDSMLAQRGFPFAGESAEN